MIDKELIELQKGCLATCVVIPNEDCKELDSKIIVNSNCSDNELLKTFKENISNKEKLNYFVISEIDKLDEEAQDKFYQIVKDREFFGIKLPKDMNGCFNCKTCIPRCVQKGDNLKDIIDAMEDASDVMLGSPVYLDMPTPQTVAFLTRLNCMAENTDRKFFANKVIHLVSTAFCLSQRFAAEQKAVFTQ